MDLLTVSVVIPVLNEAATLRRQVLILRAFLNEHVAAAAGYECHIVIADNGSTDATAAEAQTLAQEYANVAYLYLAQRGRGRALKHAWLATDSDLVAYMDVDLSTNLLAFRPLLDTLRYGCDVATGSRLMPASRIRRSFRREVLSQGYNLLIKALFWHHFSDAQCGFKAPHAPGCGEAPAADRRHELVLRYRVAAAGRASGVSDRRSARRVGGGLGLARQDHPNRHRRHQGLVTYAPQAADATAPVTHVRRAHQRTRVPSCHEAGAPQPAGGGHEPPVPPIPCPVGAAPTAVGDGGPPPFWPASACSLSLAWLSPLVAWADRSRRSRPDTRQYGYANIKQGRRPCSHPCPVFSGNSNRLLRRGAYARQPGALAACPEDGGDSRQRPPGRPGGTRCSGRRRTAAPARCRAG